MPEGRNRPLVTEEEVEDALDFLHGSAEDIGRARARASKAEHMLKVTRSQALLLSDERSHDRREAEALTSDRYIAAIDELHDAVLQAETLFARRRANEFTIEAWRTMNANQRNARV